MDSGLYAAVNGARRMEWRLEVLANNLANTNTTGYKGQNISFESFMTAPGPEQFPLPTDSFMGFRGPGDIPFPFSSPATNAIPMSYPMAKNTTVDLTQGSLQATGNPLDVAIEGEGFFRVQTPAGVQYTRDGSFAVNNQGELVTKDGYQVLDEGGGPLTVGSGPVEIARDGTLSSNQGTLGRIGLVNLPAKELEKTGQNLYSAPAGSEVPVTATTGVNQGYLEGSNANTVHSMTQMIDTHRAYESYMKMMKALDELDNQAANQVGRLQG
ncbi:MAG: flagellar basal-body rod protein FlgF [Magnetococcales bacterium]|nr:flagellar basal-body rod protein FlgF [Magnetococcales bacterium]